MNYAYFSELPVGALFSINGSACKKRSTRTHDLTYNGHTKRFYAAKNDLCVVGQYSRLSHNYFGESS